MRGSGCEGSSAPRLGLFVLPNRMTEARRGTLRRSVAATGGGLMPLPGGESKLRSFKGTDSDIPSMFAPSLMTDARRLTDWLGVPFIVTCKSPPSTSSDPLESRS